MGPLVPLAAAVAAQVAGPAALDFDARLRSCAGLAGVAGIGNPGRDPVLVTAARVDGVPGLTLASAPALPRVLAPGERLSVGLAFAAPALGAFAGSLAFETDAGPFRTRLEGEIAAVVEDRHRAPSVERVDVLFVIDDAPSMAESDRARRANLQAFAQYMRAQALDGHVAVVTPSLGGALRRLPDGRSFLRVSDEGFEASFLELTQVELQSRADRRGIRALLDSLRSAPERAPGFLRPEAVLSVIVVADADDRSATSVTAAFDQLAAIKGFWQTRRLSVSAIVPDAPGGCDGPGGQGTAARRYIALAERSGGVFQSVCTADWSRSLEDLSTLAFGYKARYRLSRRPSSPEIEVFVNQAMIPGRSPGGTVNWTYDGPGNAVVFSPFAAPEPDAEILLRYRPGCPFARTVAGVAP